MKKTFKDKSSSNNYLESSRKELDGTRWYVGIKNKDIGFIGIYLYREDKEK